jgi:hypothetical protein
VLLLAPEFRKRRNGDGQKRKHLDRDLQPRTQRKRKVISLLQDDESYHD